MSKSRTKRPSRKVGSVSERPASRRESTLSGMLLDARRSLGELVLSSGLEVFAKLPEEDRTALCGPKNKPQQDREAYRHGHDEGQVVLGGQKIRLSKPRVRSLSGEELELPHWREASREDPLSGRVLEQMLVGVVTCHIILHLVVGLCCATEAAMSRSRARHRVEL